MKKRKIIISGILGATMLLSAMPTVAAVQESTVRPATETTEMPDTDKAEENRIENDSKEHGRKTKNAAEKRKIAAERMRRHSGRKRREKVKHKKYRNSTIGMETRSASKPQKADAPAPSPTRGNMPSSHK